MPYRDDIDALQAKKDLLEDDLGRIAAHKRQLEAIARHEKQIAAELERVQRKLEERRKKLPLLSNVSIASPCNADWSQMAGDERVRFCGSCQKNVYNISAMTAEEADRLIAQKEGELCVRYYKRADGTILTADCAVGVRKKRVRRAVAGLAFGTGLMAAGSIYMRETAHMGGMHATMGEMSVDEDGPPKIGEGFVMGGMEGEMKEVEPEAKTPPPANPPPAPKGANEGSAPKKTPPAP
jgi:hypothetical protein